MATARKTAVIYVEVGADKKQVNVLGHLIYGFRKPLF